MFKLIFIKVICCFILFVTCKNAFAQPASDSSVYKQSIANLVSNFDQGIGESALLYNGFSYNNYDPNIKGNPYLNDSNTWQTGSVDYDGETFQNVPMKYDLFADHLIVLLNNHELPYRLVTEKVISFDLLHRHFVRIPSSNYGIKTGFYEELYGGRSQVLNKWEKVIKATSGTAGIEKYFTPVNDYAEYYIKKGDSYFSVSSQGDLLDLFKDKKKNLKKYIKENNIDFNGLRELALVKIATYYDHLTE